jgi:hypothetical protein
MLAAHREFLGRLLEEIDRACAAEVEGKATARTAIRTALALLSADAPSTWLLTVEILAVGLEGAKRHDAMVEASARRLRVGGDPDENRPLPTAEWV